MASNIRFRIQAKNIGPHINLDKCFDTGSLQLGLFANNGSGKTFISRLFRYISKNNPTIQDTDKLLTLNQFEGIFEFSVTDLSQNKNKLVSLFNVSLKRGTTPVINTISKKYIFHVFNDDYIKENLEEFRYKPNRNIEGYILGKEKIDIPKEKEELNKIELELKNLENTIVEIINLSRKELETLGIRNNTKELSLITYTSLFRDYQIDSELESFDILKSKLDILKLIPDNLPDLFIQTTKLDSHQLLPIQNYLEANFSRSNFAEEFKAKIRLKQGFIENGLKLLNSNNTICPFCEQNLIESSLDLINKYNEYLEDSEAQQVKQADILIDCLTLLEDEVYKIYNEHLKLKIKYDNYKEYLPSVSDNLESIEYTPEFSKNIELLKNLLQSKKENISLVYKLVEFEEYRNFLSDYIMDIIKINNMFSHILSTCKPPVLRRLKRS